jgi:hypothetical protein
MLIVGRPTDPRDQNAVPKTLKSGGKKVRAFIVILRRKKSRKKPQNGHKYPKNGFSITEKRLFGCLCR